LPKWAAGGEKYGGWALGKHLAARFGLEQRFIDIPNPV
jgi:hypothetical protein